MPRMQPATWPMISGRSGLPKFMLSVIASGRAPTAGRLRHVSAAAWAPPVSGVAEVVVVGGRGGAGADGGEVAPRLGDGLGAAGLRVGLAVAGRDVGGQRE